MKTLIVIISTVVLGVIIWGLVLGAQEGSLQSAVERVLTKGVDQMDSLTP